MDGHNFKRQQIPCVKFTCFGSATIRPQSKQRKEQAQRVASLEKGDKIITIGGLHGVVHQVGKSTVTIKLSEGVFVPFEKEAVRSVTKVGKGKKKDQEQTDDHEKDASADSEE